MTQRDKVAHHLRHIGNLTAMEAMIVYKIPRLAARINELRDMGHDIVSIPRVDGQGDRYVEYSLLRKA